MKYVSCRSGFDSVDHFAEANQAYFGQPYPSAGELLMVHGYNTHARAVEDAYRSNKEICAEEGIKLSVSGFLWPGLGVDWVQSLEFHKAQAQADKSAKFLADYLKDTDDVVVVTHSLGARVALEAVRSHGAKIKVLALMGAAVERDALTTVYKDALNNIGQVLVFYSKHDPVLGNAFKYDQFKTALGHDGPSTMPAGVKAFDCSADVWAHGDYRHIRWIWQRIKESL